MINVGNQISIALKEIFRTEGKPVLDYGFV